jgi:hypothetical protein
MIVAYLISNETVLLFFKYRTRAIITRGLYIHYPIFELHFFVSMTFFSENSILERIQEQFLIKSGLCLRA